MDQVVVAVAMNVVVSAAAADLVSTVAAVDGVVPRRRPEDRVPAVAAVECGAVRPLVAHVVVATTAVDGDRAGRPRAGFHVVVALGRAREARARGGREARLVVAVERRSAGAEVDEDVVAEAAHELDRREDAFVHEDQVVAAAGEAVDAADAGEDLLAAHSGDLDRLVAGGAADVVEDEGLVGVVLADATNTGAAAHVQPQLTRRPGLHAMVLRVRRGALVAGEVDRLRQLQRADLEVRRLADRAEEQVDSDLDGDDDVDRPSAPRLERRIQSKPGKRNSEQLRLDAGRETQAEVVDDRRRRVEVVVVLTQEDTEAELADDPEVLGPEDELPGDLEVEVSFRVHPALRGERREAEEVHVRGEVEDPLARVEEERRARLIAPNGDVLLAADLHQEGCVEPQHLEDADVAFEREAERALTDRRRR